MRARKPENRPLCERVVCVFRSAVVTTYGVFSLHSAWWATLPISVSLHEVHHVLELNRDTMHRVIRRVPDDIEIAQPAEWTVA
jgi:hypothetical protein